MPQVCKVCQQPNLKAIDLALAADISPSTLAARYSTIDRMSFVRHKENHLPQKLVEAQKHEDVRQALDVFTQLKAINGASLSILKEARDTGKHGIALQAVDRVQKQIELQAKLLGELDERPVVNILMAPEWLVVRAALFEALHTPTHPYTEARAAVASTLLQLEAGNG